MDYPKFSSFEVQVTIGEGKSAVAGAEPPLRGNPIARAPSSVWSRLVDHTERREAGDTQDTQEEERGRRSRSRSRSIRSRRKIWRRRIPKKENRR